ncbi:sulfatase-like hydrolase/transferase [Bacillus carboniphilus]|uniref:Sulfatase-like hydrolase/transferase n=1 Tax=Bacillus carboniphilus TaxID=86663 RepID=A0ABN0WAT4_9BACI
MFNPLGKKKKRPNFLILMVDEQRYPTTYETSELKSWRKEHLVTQEALRKNGIEFLNHYAGSTACSPSRTTLYTGQYPSLHGVTQTTGAAKGAFDPDSFWLHPSTVPTLGDYFRTAGYQTYWKGKWHLSDEDILIPGTHNALLSFNGTTGIPNRANEEMYKQSNQLDSYGFTGWIGPEPHGQAPHNSGSSAAAGISGRDQVYAAEVVELLGELEKPSSPDMPWLIVASFVNPHDITLYGELTKDLPTFDFQIDSSVPFIQEAPTSSESLETKPVAQKSYRDAYQKAFQPTKDTLFYRQLYYSLHKQVDQELAKVFTALQETSFYEDTIVLFTADHGSLLGSHGGLFQKWHNAYEEAIHVPFIIHNPKLFPASVTSNLLTSHVDIVPTMLGLAGIKVDSVQDELRKDHTEVHPLVGKDLTPIVYGKEIDQTDTIYFMSDDEVTRGSNQVTVTGEPYEAVIQPNHIETVITRLETGEHKEKEVWKLSRYFDNPQFWSKPGQEDQQSTIKAQVPLTPTQMTTISMTTTKTEPVNYEFEMYNITKDPCERVNLANPSNETIQSKQIKEQLCSLLEEQRKIKRIYPVSGTVPGNPF